MQDQSIDRPAPARLLFPSEVAGLFGVDPKTVGRWANEGRIPSFRTPGNHRRYREAEILAITNGGPTDLNTLLNRARQIADRIEFDFRSNMVDAEHPVAVVVWFGDVCEDATAATPAEALAAAIEKLSAYLTGERS